MKVSHLYFAYCCIPPFLPLYFVPKNNEKFRAQHGRHPRDNEASQIIWKSTFQSLFFPYYLPKSLLE
uniref:Uncharacterized protein n=1 Tax=Marseillevirus sp. TaxID=2809551 RepID=A0AA96J3M6_9VIRU|nr:hypothetical protein MarDSR_196 [Marseillevirus sp.]